MIAHSTVGGKFAGVSQSTYLNFSFKNRILAFPFWDDAGKKKPRDVIICWNSCNERVVSDGPPLRRLRTIAFGICRITVSCPKTKFKPPGRLPNEIYTNSDRRHFKTSRWVRAPYIRSEHRKLTHLCSSLRRRRSRYQPRKKCVQKCCHSAQGLI